MKPLLLLVVDARAGVDHIIPRRRVGRRRTAINDQSRKWVKVNGHAMARMEAVEGSGAAGSQQWT